MATYDSPLSKGRGCVVDMKRICTVNELFLLRLMPANGSNEKSAPSHSIVISLNNAASPSKAAQLSTLGVEPNPFYVSIVHPRPCRSLHLCCASIGPVNSFRPDILRAALRVFVPQGCRTGTWTKAVSWFWKTLEASKGKSLPRENNGSKRGGSSSGRPCGKN